MSGADRQLQMEIDSSRGRPLFSDHYLYGRLPERPEFSALDVSQLHGALRDLWRNERETLEDAKEAQTEDRFIRPVLGLLGFHYTVRVEATVGRRRREPDYALYPDDRLRAEAERLEGNARYESALAVAEAKRFDRPPRERLQREHAAGLERLRDLSTARDETEADALVYELYGLTTAQRSVVDSEYE